MRLQNINKVILKFESLVLSLCFSLVLSLIAMPLGGQSSKKKQPKHSLLGGGQHNRYTRTNDSDGRNAKGT